MSPASRLLDYPDPPVPADLADGARAGARAIRRRRHVVVASIGTVALAGALALSVPSTSDGTPDAGDAPNPDRLVAAEPLDVAPRPDPRMSAAAAGPQPLGELEVGQRELLSVGPREGNADLGTVELDSKLPVRVEYVCVGPGAITVVTSDSAGSTGCDGQPTGMHDETNSASSLDLAVEAQPDTRWRLRVTQPSRPWEVFAVRPVRASTPVQGSEECVLPAIDPGPGEDASACVGDARLRLGPVLADADDVTLTRPAGEAMRTDGTRLRDVTLELRPAASEDLRGASEVAVLLEGRLVEVLPVGDATTLTLTRLPEDTARQAMQVVDAGM
jgi:hypothetical protein